MLGNTLNYKVVKGNFGNPFKKRENNLLFSSLLKPLRATTLSFESYCWRRSIRYLSLSPRTRRFLEGRMLCLFAATSAIKTLVMFFQSRKKGPRGETTFEEICPEVAFLVWVGRRWKVLGGGEGSPPLRPWGPPGPRHPNTLQLSHCLKILSTQKRSGKIYKEECLLSTQIATWPACQAITKVLNRYPTSPRTKPHHGHPRTPARCHTHCPRQPKRCLPTGQTGRRRWCRDLRGVWAEGGGGRAGTFVVATSLWKENANY